MKTLTPNMPAFFLEQKRQAAQPNTWRRDLWVAWCDLGWFEQFTMGLFCGGIGVVLLVLWITS